MANVGHVSNKPILLVKGTVTTYVAVCVTACVAVGVAMFVAVCYESLREQARPACQKTLCVCVCV